MKCSLSLINISERKKNEYIVFHVNALHVSLYCENCLNLTFFDDETN